MGNDHQHKKDKKKNKKIDEDEFNKEDNNDKKDNIGEEFILEEWEVYNDKNKNIDNSVKFDKDLLISEANKDPYEEYKEIKMLGEGSYGQIFLVNHKVIGATRAMKIIQKVEDVDENNVLEILNEINVLKKIDHPNIIKIFECYMQKGNYYLVTEYCSGGELFELVNNTKFTEVQVAYLMYQLFSSINYCHKMKIIHRDLKPENILLSKDRSNLKIIDFGISSVVFTSFDKNAKKEIKHFSTNENQLYGTYPYISPSLYLAYSPKATTEKRFEVINEQCDFFSIGIILYEMLTGNKPFNGDLNDQKVILLPLRYDIPPLSKNNPKISPAIENVIFRCIASKPDDLKYRYTNVKEIIKDVDDIINNPQEGKLTELIKPYNKRTIQANVFDIESEKSKLKFYNSS